MRVSAAEREHLFHVAGLMLPGQGTVPAYITPGVQRMLDRLTGTPVAVFDAACTLLLANPLYEAVMGEHCGNERNAVWRNTRGPDQSAPRQPMPPVRRGPDVVLRGRRRPVRGRGDTTQVARRPAVSRRPGRHVAGQIACAAVGPDGT